MTTDEVYFHKDLNIAHMKIQHIAVQAAIKKKSKLPLQQKK
jgi:hypothetical protein